MRFNFQDWIENVQQKPEHIRMRYMFGCVALTMVLVLGVWSLSVSESFRTIAGDAVDVSGTVEGFFPKASKFSLDSVLSGEKSFDDLKREVSGEAYLEKQKEDGKNKPNFKEDGFRPQSQGENTQPSDTGNTSSPVTSLGQ